MEAYNSLLKTGRGMHMSSARLSTGIKINKASQNAAGLAISNTLRVQAEGVEKASQNSSNAISLLQTVEGALSEMHAIMQRIRELAVQASNDTNEIDDRESLQKEINQLVAELDSMSDRCEYNQIKLLRGGGNETRYDADGNIIREPLFLTFHTGANKGYNTTIEIPSVSSLTLGLEDGGTFWSIAGINVAAEAAPPVGPLPSGVVPPLSPEVARDMRTRALETADAAVEMLSRHRANLGAYMNRLQHTVNYLDASHTAASASLSRIYDTDMAAEMSNYSRLQVLTQTATSIMAQANQTPQNVLQLLQ